MAKIQNVEDYLEKYTHWSEAIQRLRDLVRSTELEETIKWGAPTYCLDGKNVLGLAAFKHHFCIWFFNGVFLKDEKQLLVNAQEGKTKALRQMRFTSTDEINEEYVLEYIKEAIKNQRLGKEIKPKRNTKPIVVPEELKKEFSKNAELQLKFKSLAPSHQREYAEYISEAKREDTKQRRLQKIIPLLLEGKSMYEKYK